MIKLMPAVFVGHGSPLNGIKSNDFTRSLSELGKNIPRPEKILLISAHWMKRGISATHMKSPRTIYDFHGFPKELYDIKYPAPGSPELAEDVKKILASENVQLDDSEWGIDHGGWTVLLHLFPEADIPVVQLSLDMSKGFGYHFDLGKRISELRHKGVLILGSGNLVHNLRAIDWEENAPVHNWALEFDNWAKGKILKMEFESLTKELISMPSGRMAHPTVEHYLPLLYVLGAALPSDRPQFFFEGIQNASISMSSFLLSS